MLALWQIDGLDIRRLQSDDKTFTSFLNALLYATAALHGISDSDVRTNLRTTIPGGGVDAALAEAVLIPHAAPGGKAESTAKSILARGQPLLTLADECNAHLIQAGAEVHELGRVKLLLSRGSGDLDKGAKTVGQDERMIST